MKFSAISEEVVKVAAHSLIVLITQAREMKSLSHTPSFKSRGASQIAHASSQTHRTIPEVVVCSVWNKSNATLPSVCPRGPEASLAPRSIGSRSCLGRGATPEGSRPDTKGEATLLGAAG
jgi:hypothetical protein